LGLVNGGGGAWTLPLAGCFDLGPENLVESGDVYATHAGKLHADDVGGAGKLGDRRRGGVEHSPGKTAKTFFGVNGEHGLFLLVVVRPVPRYKLA
jgi:hypothetical protein